MTQNLINVKLTDLIGKKVNGLRAQVTNPKYKDAPKRWRILKEIKTHTENGKQWVQLYWNTEQDGFTYDCGFTGSTIKSDLCTIQFEPTEYNKIN